MTNNKLLEILPKVFSPVIKADISSQDNIELAIVLQEEVQRLHNCQLKEILTIDYICSVMKPDMPVQKKFLNKEQMSVMAGLVKKLLGQIPLEEDLNVENFDAMGADQNASIFQYNRASTVMKDRTFNKSFNNNNNSFLNSSRFRKYTT